MTLSSFSWPNFYPEFEAGSLTNKTCVCHFVPVTLALKWPSEVSGCMDIEVYRAKIALLLVNASCSTDRLFLWSFQVFVCMLNDAVALL